jgi:hypothetical protein
VIAKIAITFFIFVVLLFKFKYTLIGITLHTKYKVIEFLYSKGTDPMPVPHLIYYPTQLFLNVLAFFKDVSY